MNRAAIAYALLLSGWLAFIAAAWLWWGAAAALVVVGVGMLATGGAQLWVVTFPGGRGEVQP
jgi:hypothetical protein